MPALPASTDATPPVPVIIDQPVTLSDQLLFQQALGALNGLVYTPVGVIRPPGEQPFVWFRCTISQPVMGTRWESLIQIQTSPGEAPSVVLIQPVLSTLANGDGPL